VKAQGFLYLSGSLGLDPDTGKIIEGGVQAETKRALETIKLKLAEGDSSFDQVIKMTVLVADMADFAQVNEVYATYFTDGPPPARTCYAVKELPVGGKVEIETIAVYNQ
jgi:2-iminobutanoate/2-iminopropanoate deaminase